MAGRAALPRPDAVLAGAQGGAVGGGGQDEPGDRIELFLSRRTVESHISSALRKLGYLSRKELAALPLDEDGAETGALTKNVRRG
ncbi:LuxR C-terminal-related transcriptional regulator [Micromonospora yasonensis]|uniref:LuxR C-terminal-related transcriptional regulator n=1 Tax=Micromonospora yasonensis TaxID=1128667 RepID=UPI003872E82F